MVKNNSQTPEELYLTGVTIVFVLKGNLSLAEINSFVDYLNEAHESGIDIVRALYQKHGHTKVTIDKILK